MQDIPLSIPQLLRQNAKKFESRAAFVNEAGNELSHSPLFDHVKSTAESLNAMGIARNQRVAIVLPQGPELATTFLCVASVATAAPLNYNYTQEDFEFYLEDLNARALIIIQGDDTPARLAAEAKGVRIVEIAPRKVRDGRFDIFGTCQPLDGEEGFAQPEDVALVLHTSGTTSRPKIVPLTHSNLCVSTKNICETLRLGKKDRCLNIMPLFHIHGLVACILASLSSGGSTICTRSLNAEKFTDWLEAWKPTWYSAVPTMHQAILSQVRSGQAVSSSLRFIRSSSAALPPPVMAGLEKAFSVPVIESYGMTEAAHQMASNPLPPLERKPGSVGLAAGPEIYILDEDGNQLDRGDKGEIAIKGSNVTRGYDNNPEANSSAYTQGWFRTGDQGYIDGEGYLFLTGRLKEMINRGGENIAPREIDEALLSHPGVRQAVGFAVPHESLGEDVAAAVILEKGVEVGESELRNYALEKLADYKVPSRIVILDDIPKGPTGKLQRIGLADKLTSELEESFQAPVSETEQLICKTIEEVLTVNEVGISQNFFAMGGDSLRSTQVINRLNDALELSLPLNLIFRFPTAALLAKEVDDLVEEHELDQLARALGDLTEDEQSDLLEEGSLPV